MSYSSRNALASAARVANEYPVLESLSLVVLAALLIYQLAIPPIIGLADTGDYARVMHPLGVFHVENGREYR